MHEIEVEILDAAGGQLALEKRADVLLGLEEGGGQLVRQDIALARVAARQTLAQGAGKSIPFSGRYIRKTDPLTAYRYFPVMLSGLARMSSGVPQATMRPPASPPPGPMSMI